MESYDENETANCIQLFNGNYKLFIRIDQIKGNKQMSVDNLKRVIDRIHILECRSRSLQ